MSFLFVSLSGFPASGWSARGRKGSESTTFRCGNDLVSPGDSVEDVLLRCGEPSYRHATGARGRSRTIKRKNGGASGDESTHGSLSSKRKRTVSRTVYEEEVAETWYYNRGPDDFVYSLHFEGGVLTRIVQGNRGK